MVKHLFGEDQEELQTLLVVTTAQKLALVAVEGDVVYDSTLDAICTYNGAAWIRNQPVMGLNRWSVVTAGGVYNSTSTTYVDIDATNIVTRFTTSSTGRALVSITGYFLTNHADTKLELRLVTSGGTQLGYETRLIEGLVKGLTLTAKFYLRDLTANTTYSGCKFQWRNSDLGGGQITLSVNVTVGATIGSECLMESIALIGSPS